MGIRYTVGGADSTASCEELILYGWNRSVAPAGLFQGERGECGDAI